MKRSTGNFILVIIVIALAGYATYYYLQQNEQVKIESDITYTTVSEDNVPKKTVAFTREFNLPIAVEDHQVVKKPYYTLSYNNTHEQPDWVAYTLYPFPDSISVKRKNSFRPDPEIVGGSATLADYKRSGYDRGHLAPSKAFSFSKEAMKTTYFMSNMSPQLPGFNRDIWRKLEAKIYALSKDSDSLYVVTGPILDNILGSIGENKVSIPRAYYKTVVKFKDGNINGIGFLLKNEKNRASFWDFSTSIDSIESVTGIDFYYQFDAALQDRIEQNKSIKDFE